MVIVGVVAASAVSMLAGSADAKGKPVRVSLSCATITGTATLTVQMKSTLFGGNIGSPVTLTCGPNSVSGLTTDTTTIKGLSAVPGAYSFSASYTTSNGSGGCGGAATRGTVSTCNDNANALAITFNAA